MLIKDTSYGLKGHPSMGHNMGCTGCSLGILRDEHNERHSGEEKYVPQVSVGGVGPLDLKKVKLIVFSDHPGHWEAMTTICYSMHDRTIASDFKERKGGLLQPRNAGYTMRESIDGLFGLDPYRDVYYTNAVKCTPNKETVLESKHIVTCTNMWLNNELVELNNKCPTAPIIIAGTMAFKAIRSIYGEILPIDCDEEDRKSLKSLGFNGSRRRVFMLQQHPTIVTFNPAMPSRSEPRIETKIKDTNKGITVVQNEWLHPYLPRSPKHVFLKDIAQLRKYINT